MYAFLGALVDLYRLVCPSMPIKPRNAGVYANLSSPTHLVSAWRNYLCHSFVSIPKLLEFFKSLKLLRPCPNSDLILLNRATG